MAETKRQLLSIGVFIIILVVAIVLFAAGAIDWTLIVPVVLVLFGVWLLALASLRGVNHDKYARSPFSTAVMGLLLVAVGGAWFLSRVNWLYSVALVLLVLAGVAIAAALKRK